MDSNSGSTAHFHLFDAAGMGLIGLDGNNLVLQANDSFLRYLETEAADVLGREASDLGAKVSSAEFWNHLSAKGSFYALIPGQHHLFLGSAVVYSNPAESALERIVLLRPYSLEREFMRMRSRLNQNVALEISEHLGSLAVAGEIILQPELRQDETSREHFLTTFFSDIQDLSQLFSELQDIAEPIPFPNRVHFVRVDHRSLVADMLAKMKGFIGERSVSIASSLPSNLPAVQGDHQWLSLALYGVISHALTMAPPLDEVSVSCSVEANRLETAITYLQSDESPESEDWPPKTLFPLPDDDPRIGRMGFTDLAVSRCILLLHGGDLAWSESEGRSTLAISLPL